MNETALDPESILSLLPAVDTWKATRGLRRRVEAFSAGVFTSGYLWASWWQNGLTGTSPGWLQPALLSTVCLFAMAFGCGLSAALTFPAPRFRIRAFRVAIVLFSAAWLLSIFFVLLLNWRSTLTWRSALILVTGPVLGLLLAWLTRRNLKSVRVPDPIAGSALIDELEHRIRETNDLIQSPRVLLLGPLSEDSTPPWLRSFDDGFLFSDGRGEAEILPRGAVRFPLQHLEHGLFEVAFPLASGERAYPIKSTYDLQRFLERAGLP